LFNWLYARKHKGTLVLRIEDTDRERSTEESFHTILDSLTWLGLSWDEGPGQGGEFGPYTQMERLEIYKRYADQLIEEGKAYRCYATKEELEGLRKEAEARKKQFVYPHLWREKGPSDWLDGQPYVVRFKTPLVGQTTFHDEVFGTITTPNNSPSVQDFVLLRSDGIPLYNFGSAIDDMLMKITLVARGRDHLGNTVQQILLYEALGTTAPKFAHLPMMLGPDGKKLSKREAERYDIPVSVTAYRDRGFSAEGLLNYLVRFGWSHGDQEVFSKDELISLFDFDHVSKSDGKFDMKKCLAINHKHLKEEALTPTDRYLEQLAPHLTARGLPPREPSLVQAALATVRERGRTFAETADALDFYLRDHVQWDEKSRQTHLTSLAAERLRGLAALLAEQPSFVAKPLDETVHAWLVTQGLTIKDVAQPARVALTGRAASPPLFDVMEVLGRERTLQRLIDGATWAAQNVPTLSIAPPHHE